MSKKTNKKKNKKEKVNDIKLDINQENKQEFKPVQEETKKEEPEVEEEYRITEEEKVYNLKHSKIRIIIQYFIPLIIDIVLALKYIPTQNNYLLIPFSIVMLITLYGWDSATRTCPKCKKWNSVNWSKSENAVRITTEEKRTLFGRKKEKQIKEKIKKVKGRCKNCGNMCESEKNKIF